MKQKDHHKKKSAREELIENLKLNDVEYNPQFLLEDITRSKA
jgi:hypothetical protein